MADDVHYWLALTRVEGLGARGAHKLVEQLGSPVNVYKASLSQLQSCGLPSRVAHGIVAGGGLKEAEAQVAAVSKADCAVVTCTDAEYPPLLKQIADPPLALYVRESS